MTKPLGAEAQRYWKPRRFCADPPNSYFLYQGQALYFRCQMRGVEPEDLPVLSMSIILSNAKEIWKEGNNIHVR